MPLPGGRRLSEDQVKRAVSRWRKVKLNKGNWLNHWDDLARLLLPRRTGFVTQFIEGDRRTEEIYDATGMRAARSLRNVVSQLLRPEGEKWFLIRAEDDRLNNLGEVVEWIKRAEEKTWSAMINPKTRFRQATGESDLDLIVFGTSILFIGMSKAARRLRYQTIHLKDVELAINDENIIDTVYYLRKYDLRQAVQKFGKENLSVQTQQKIDNASGREEIMDEKLEFLRIIRPRTDGTPDAILARNLPFSDLWIEIDNHHHVQDGGFHEFPFAVPRWDTSSGELYGRSPGMIALPDVETLNAMGETILVAGQKAADPPIMAPNDSSFEALNTFSGGISYYDVDTAERLGGNPFFPLVAGQNLPITRDMQSDTRFQVEAAFFKNVFNLPVDGPEMTATEVLQRNEEFIREMGPVFGNLESDYQSPLVERSFALLLRDGAFDPIPEVLSGRNIRFEYTSPVHKIREQTQVAAARLWLQELVELGQIDQNVIDNADVDVIARFSARALDLMPGALKTEDVVEAARQQKQAKAAEDLERQRVAEEAQIAQMGGKAVKDVSQALTPEQLEQIQSAEVA